MGFSVSQMATHTCVLSFFRFFVHQFDLLVSEAYFFPAPVANPPI